MLDVTRHQRRGRRDESSSFDPSDCGVGAPASVAVAAGCESSRNPGDGDRADPWSSRDDPLGTT
jgi:hypothetical protein